MREKLNSMAYSARRIQETWEKLGDVPFEQDDDIRDIVLLNLQRFLEDLADCCRRLVRIRKLGTPRDNKEVFKLLQQGGLIDTETRRSLEKANAMRNIMTYRYATIELDEVKNVVKNDLGPLFAVAQELVRQEHSRFDNPAA